MMPNNFSCHPSMPAWAPGPVLRVTKLQNPEIRRGKSPTSIKDNKTPTLKWCHLKIAVKRLIHMKIFEWIHGSIVLYYYMTNRKRLYLFRIKIIKFINAQVSWVGAGKGEVARWSISTSHKKSLKMLQFRINRLQRQVITPIIRT